MTEKQKALEAFVVAMADDERDGPGWSERRMDARDALLAAIEAENKPEPESIVERMRFGDHDGCMGAIRDLERLAERIREYTVARDDAAHEIDGK